MKSKNKSETKVLLFAIRQPYSSLILLGKKKFELRKRVPRANCKYALIYETSPTQAIVGMFEIDRIYHNDVDAIWEITKQKASVSKIDFKKYYQNKDKAVAIRIKKAFTAKRRIPLSEVGVDFTPQDYVYLSEAKTKPLIERLIALC